VSRSRNLLRQTVRLGGQETVSEKNEEIQFLMSVRRSPQATEGGLSKERTLVGLQYTCLWPVHLEGVLA